MIDPSETATDRLAAVAAASPTEADLVADAEAVALRLPDRTLTVRWHDHPAAGVRWTLDLESDGALISKFGPFDSADALAERVAGLVDAEVGYTVCCDGDA